MAHDTEMIQIRRGKPAEKESRKSWPLASRALIPQSFIPLRLVCVNCEQEVLRRKQQASGSLSLDGGLTHPHAHALTCTHTRTTHGTQNPIPYKSTPVSENDPSGCRDSSTSWGPPSNPLAPQRPLPCSPALKEGGPGIPPPAGWLLKGTREKGLLTRRLRSACSQSGGWAGDHARVPPSLH